MEIPHHEVSALGKNYQREKINLNENLCSEKKRKRKKNSHGNLFAEFRGKCVWVKVSTLKKKERKRREKNSRKRAFKILKIKSNKDDV